MTKAELAEQYRQLLREEGYISQVDDEGDVLFKCDGASYFIVVNEKDLEYFQLLSAGHWTLEDDDEHDRALVAATRATKATKVAKVYLVGNKVRFSVEMFCSPPMVVKPVLTRCVTVIRLAVETFRAEMQK